ncbi:radical SAM protein [Candidatus Woesearchaeota archaeon]|nr:radical SAM protein [Candidatus Woesearchaeota archaeon]
MSDLTIKKAIQLSGRFPSTLSKIGFNNGRNLYFSAENLGEEEEPEFVLTTNDLAITFAVTGDMTGMYRVNPDSIETVVSQDPQHTYTLKRKSLPLGCVADQANATPEQLLEQLVGFAYDEAKTVSEGELKGIGKDFSVLTYEAIVARFLLLKSLQSSTDIIPDQTHRTIFVKAGDGCGKACTFCPESTVPFKPYTIDQFIAELERTEEAMGNILGDKMRRMNEGFINISDVLRLDQDKRTDLTAAKAVELMREYFPWLEKIGSFVSSESALAYSRTGRGYTRENLSRLWETGLNRLYLGVETAHDEGSRLLGKNISYDQKLEAARLVQAANIKLKAIFQVGILGQGFYRKNTPRTRENFVTWEQVAERNADWVNAAQPYRVYESIHQELPGLAISDDRETLRIIPYAFPGQYERESQFFRSQIRLMRRGKDPIENGYHIYLPKERAIVIAA